MPENSRHRIDPAYSPEMEPTPTHESAANGFTPNRLTGYHVLPAIAFPVIGCVLYVLGMPVSEIFKFLLGCSGIGVMVTIAVTGGRRLAVTVAHSVLTLTNTK
ncbi:hypothetical protein [Streptomyces sp. NPDC007856]|uniref:hypothetical protein n=1 Tax=Streptomyces sp. NPDC007856 TaxID=3364781 RepID=UPI0036833CBE